MKTNVRTASLEAHDQNKASGLYAKQTQQVATYAKTVDKFTRRMIEDGAGIRPSSVTRALDPLLAAGHVVELEGLAPCPISKRRVGWLAHKDRITPQQGSLDL